jgi:hypothetical protein
MTHASLIDIDHRMAKSKEEYPLTVREAAKYLGVSAQLYIFGLSESRFPISA